MRGEKEKERHLTEKERKQEAAARVAWALPGLLAVWEWAGGAKTK